jgi:hypothetical protein
MAKSLKKTKNISTPFKGAAIPMINTAFLPEKNSKGTIIDLVNTADLPEKNSKGTIIDLVNTNNKNNIQNSSHKKGKKYIIKDSQESKGTIINLVNTADLPDENSKGTIINLVNTADLPEKNSKGTIIDLVKTDNNNNFIETSKKKSNSKYKFIIYK